MKIKICGITNLKDALMAIEAGADMLGFNFYLKSPRYIGPDACAAILRLLLSRRAAFTGIGVFVNSPVEQVIDILEKTGLDLAQLSGDEPAEDLVVLGKRAFKAVRISAQANPKGGNVTNTTRERIQEYAHLREGQPPEFLLDAAVHGAYGGTGVVTDWKSAAGLATQFRFLLAGGLTAENVAEAIESVHPWGVDVASGVEDSPGEKNANKVKQFIRNARSAARETSQQKDFNQEKSLTRERKS